MTKIKVITRSLSALGSSPFVKIIDHDNQADRIWLGKHCFWAMRNNCSVLTIPVKDKNHEW